MQITHSAYIYTKKRKSGDTVCEVHTLVKLVNLVEYHKVELSVACSKKQDSKI